MHPGHIRPVLRKVDYAPGILWRAEKHQAAVRFLQLGGKHPACVAHRHRKGNQCGGNADVHKGSGHAVLSADGGNLKLLLGLQAAQKRHEGTRPLLRVASQLFEKLLKGQIDFGNIAAHGRNLRNRIHHRVQSAVVGALLRQLRVVAVAHQRGRVGASLHQGQLGRHAAGRRQLVLSAQGHQYRPRADGAVKALG